MHAGSELSTSKMLLTMISILVQCSHISRHLLYEKVLYWLEVLSLIKAIPLAKESLQVAVDFLKVCSLLLTLLCLSDLFFC